MKLTRDILERAEFTGFGVKPGGAGVRVVLSGDGSRQGQALLPTWQVQVGTTSELSINQLALHPILVIP